MYPWRDLLDECFLIPARELVSMMWADDLTFLSHTNQDSISFSAGYRFWLWASYLTSLSLGFLICKMRMICILQIWMVSLALSISPLAQWFLGFFCLFVFYFDCTAWLVRSQFPIQGLNPGHGSESTESWLPDHQATPLPQHSGFLSMANSNKNNNKTLYPYPTRAAPLARSFSRKHLGGYDCAC